MSPQPWSRKGFVVPTAQELGHPTECLEYWTQTEGGLCTHDKRIHGVRVEDGTIAEFLDGQRLATHFARALQPNGTAANKLKTHNQRVTFSNTSMNMKDKIGVIIGRDHPALKSAGIKFYAGEKFALLGAFFITDRWIDWQKTDEGLNMVLMVHMQKCDTDRIWWNDSTVDDAQDDPKPEHDFSQDKKECETCGKPLIRRYNEGDIFCGHVDCDSSNSASAYASLPAIRTYAKSYLARRFPTTGFSARPFELSPQQVVTQPTVQDIKTAVKNKSDHHPGWKSWVCDDCLPFNRRMHWSFIQCHGCGKRTEARMPDMTLEQLVENDKWFDVKDTSVFFRQPGILDEHVIKISQPDTVKAISLPPTKSHVGVRIDFACGSSVYVLVPTKFEINRDGGTRSLFEQTWRSIQSGEMDIKRVLLNGALKVGEEKFTMIKSSMSINYGAQYNFCASQKTIPFSQRPEAARALMEYNASIVEQVLEQKTHYNEQLMLVYMPRGKISPHRNDEKGIQGDSITLFSLCAAGRMIFSSAVNGKCGKTIISFPLPCTGAIMIMDGPLLNQSYFHEAKNLGVARIVSTLRQL